MNGSRPEMSVLSDDEIYKQLCEEAALCRVAPPTFKETFGYDKAEQEEFSLKVASMDPDLEYFRSLMKHGYSE